MGPHNLRFYISCKDETDKCRYMKILIFSFLLTKVSNTFWKPILTIQEIAMPHTSKINFSKQWRLLRCSQMKYRFN